MIEEVEADFPFNEIATLESIEMGMRAVEDNVRFGMALLAVSLGRIKRERLYSSVASDFKSYLVLERTNLSYSKAIHLSAIGQNYWDFQTELRQNDIKLSKNMSKVRLLEMDIVTSDPMFWERFKNMSVRELKSHIEKTKDSLNVCTGESLAGSVTATSSGLFIAGEKVRGFNLKEARQKVGEGKRALVIWVDNDSEARKVKRTLEKSSFFCN